MKKVMIAAAFVFCAAAVSMAQSATGSTDKKIEKAPSEVVTGVEAHGKKKKCDEAEKAKCSKKGKKCSDKEKAACHDKKAAVIDRKKSSKGLV